MKNIFSFLLEIVAILAITVIIVWPIRYFLAQPFFVKGASMEPNFEDGQYLVINEISYRFQAPARGDVVVFRYPLDPTQYYIKRVIGLPGETVEVSNGRVTIYNSEHRSGFVLDESAYLSPEVSTNNDIRTVLGDKEFFVMGDNRAASYDSRRWGPLPQKDIIGKAWMRAWPLNTATIFHPIQYSY